MTEPPKSRLTGRVPVIVVTGFLGSGKTTLLNRLLARRAARDPAGASGKIALVVNELGEVGVDGDLLAGGARQVELPGGCVCCVLGEELERTVIELIASQPGGLDAIVLETTGVAEPLPIAWAFGRSPLDRVSRLAVIVTLVDAIEHVASRPVSPAVDEQVRHADVVVVTKAELAGAGATAAVEAVVRELAPHAPIVRGTTDEAAAWLEGVIADVDVYAHGTHPHAHEHLDADGHGIDTVWVPAPATLDLEELEDHLAALPGHYIRIKGIVHAVDGRGGDPMPRWHAVHRVGLRVSSEPVSTPVGGGRIVGLGPDVERAPLAACIEAAVLSSRDDGAER